MVRAVFLRGRKMKVMGLMKGKKIVWACSGMDVDGMGWTRLS